MFRFGKTVFPSLAKILNRQVSHESTIILFVQKTAPYSNSGKQCRKKIINSLELRTNYYNFFFLQQLTTNFL